MSTFLPAVEGNDMEGIVRPWRWSQAPSSVGAGMEEGKDVSGRESVMEMEMKDRRVRLTGHAAVFVSVPDWKRQAAIVVGRKVKKLWRYRKPSDTIRLAQ